MKKQLAVSVDGVRKFFGKRSVLNGVKFQANTRELICIVGENGSGKSTLLKIIAGILGPDSGVISRKGSLGYCPQESLLYDYLSVEEHFRLFGMAYKMSRALVNKNAQDLMELFSFYDYRHHKIHQLSGGTRQKLNLSLSLLHDPTTLLLDEPYVGFDYETYESFLNYTKLAINKKCIIMVSHLVYEKHLFNKIYTLKEGVIHEDH